jgi:hypothetical protein
VFKRAVAAYGSRPDNGRTALPAVAATAAVAALLPLQMLREAEKAGAASCPVAAVTDAISEAATSAWPRGRYHVGPNAAAYHWLRRLLPDKVWFRTMQQAVAREYRKEACREYCNGATAAGAHAKAA